MYTVQCTSMELFGVRLDMVGVYCVVGRQEARCVIPTRHELRKSDTLNTSEASSAFVGVLNAGW
jgi:hypothetical protein